MGFGSYACAVLSVSCLRPSSKSKKPGVRDGLHFVPGQRGSGIGSV